MFDKNRFSTGEFLSDQPVSAPVAEPVSVPSWHTNTNYSPDFRNYLKKIYGNNELKDVVLNRLAEVWKKNPSQIITTANEKTKAANDKALQEQRAAEERRRNARSQWNQDNAKHAVKVEPKEQPAPAPAPAPSNDFSNIANFNEAFRQASKAGLKTFVWKKTKGNPSGLFSTEVASKETEKPALKPKEKKSGESTPASKVQPQTKKDYAFDGSHIDFGKFPYVESQDDTNFPEFGPEAQLFINPTPSDGGYAYPLLYPHYSSVTYDDSEKYKDGTPKVSMYIPVNTEVPEITGSNGSEFGKWYKSNRLKEQEKRDEYFRRKGMYKKGGTMNKVNYFSQGGTTPNGQADAFMQAVLQGNSEAIGQLIEAAKQGNKDADKLIQTILQEDKKGNQQVTKAASVIKQLLNQTVSAKWGSKLQYIRSLKFAKGGKTCPACEGGNKVKVAKKDVDKDTYQRLSEKQQTEIDSHYLGTATSDNKDGSYNISHKPTSQDSIHVSRKVMSKSMSKKYPEKKECGGKAKKHYFGGWL